MTWHAVITWRDDNGTEQAAVLRADQRATLHAHVQALRVRHGQRPGFGIDAYEIVRTDHGTERRDATTREPIGDRTRGNATLAAIRADLKAR